MKIELFGKRGVAEIDDEDYEKIKHLKWSLSHYGYAVACGKPRGTVIFMHRLIMNTPKGMETDHINGDPLDNRKDNLRICTHKENMRNHRHRKQANKTSLYSGVYRTDKKWSVRVGEFLVGRFENERHAAIAYDIWAKDLWGEFANTNFKSI